MRTLRRGAGHAWQWRKLGNLFLICALWASAEVEGGSLATRVHSSALCCAQCPEPLSCFCRICTLQSQAPCGQDDCQRAQWWVTREACQGKRLDLLHSKPCKEARQASAQRCSCWARSMHSPAGRSVICLFAKVQEESITQGKESLVELELPRKPCSARWRQSETQAFQVLPTQSMTTARTLLRTSTFEDTLTSAGARPWCVPACGLVTSFAIAPGISSGIVWAGSTAAAVTPQGRRGKQPPRQAAHPPMPCSLSAHFT